MGRMPPPPTATITDPTTAASSAYHRPVTIRGAICSWSKAAKAANTKIAIPAPWASSCPPWTAPSRLDNRSVIARAMAAATTRITMATKMLGRYAIRPRSRSETGLGPNTPKASWSTNSMIVQNTSLARMSEGSYLLRASTWRTPPRSTTRSKPTRSRTVLRMLATALATIQPTTTMTRAATSLGTKVATFDQALSIPPWKSTARYMHTPCRGTLHLLYRDHGVAMTHSEPRGPHERVWPGSVALREVDHGHITSEPAVHARLRHRRPHPGQRPAAMVLGRGAVAQLAYLLGRNQ